MWRELRRIREPQPGQGELFEDARAAADEGNWMAFSLAMQGTSIRLSREPAAEPSRYGESREVVRGVETMGHVRDGIVVLWRRVRLITRDRQWRIVPATIRERTAGVRVRERSAPARALGPVSITVPMVPWWMAPAGAGRDVHGPPVFRPRGRSDPPRVTH